MASPVSGANDTWVVRDVSLPFPIGSRELYCKHVRAAVRNGYFARLPPEPDDRIAAEPVSRFGVVLVRSHPVACSIRRIVVRRHYIRYVPRTFSRFHADTTGSFDDYLKQFSAKSRNTLRRKVRKYTTQVGGAQPIAAYGTPDALRTFHGLARRVSSRTYQERHLHAGLPIDPEVLEGIGRGQGRGYLLFDGERPVAYLFCPIRDGVALYQYLGYDPAYADRSPGIVLQYFVMQEMFADVAIHRLDFTEGEGDQKAFFATGSTPCADIMYLRPSLGNLALVGAHASYMAAAKGGARLAGQLGLKSRLRKLLRGSPEPPAETSASDR
jgi:CelD/BcsL family acetyltransferase involved in cellulose biosynthesis